MIIGDVMANGTAKLQTSEAVQAIHGESSSSPLLMRVTSCAYPCIHSRHPGLNSVCRAVTCETPAGEIESLSFAAKFNINSQSWRLACLIIPNNGAMGHNM